MHHLKPILIRIGNKGHTYVKIYMKLQKSQKRRFCISLEDYYWYYGRGTLFKITNSVLYAIGVLIHFSQGNCRELFYIE
jgi:hypothetical protein